MPNVNKRDEIEARLARILGKANRQALTLIKEKLGDPPKAYNLTSEVWKEVQSVFDVALLPELENVFHDAAAAMVDHIGVGVEWDLINKRAADWARQYTYDLVTNLTDNSQTIVQNAVTDFYNGRLDLGALEDRLTRTFGPIRAQSIAVTETTRAASQGEAAYADELRKLGAELVAVWHTENDDRTCPICAPLNGKDQGDGWEDFPPAHPMCRCATGWRVVLPETANKAVFYYLRTPDANQDRRRTTQSRP